MKMTIAVDVGGTNLKLALVDDRFRIRHKAVMSTREFRSKEELIAGIAAAVRAVAARHKSPGVRIVGVGVGLPGPIDAARGIVHFLPNIPGFRNVRLRSLLEKRLGFPVTVDNDAKLMTLAEFTRGAAAGYRNALCITLGTGVGGGLILDGKLYRGADNASGELGHVPINEAGPACNCGGTACLESYVGNARILEQARKRLGRDVSLEELSALAKKGDAAAMDVWVSVGSRLGMALAGVVNLLNLDVIVIGGGVANAGRVLFDELRLTLARRAMSVQAGRVRLCKARLGSDAGLIGAAIAVSASASGNYRTKGPAA